MVQSQLTAYSGSDPIWGFVALVRSEVFTGEAAVGLDPRVRLFAVDGHIYFAEREDDAPVGTRLVNCGAISAMQLARGAVQAGGNESLARLFQRDATIDRDAVELTVATSTEKLLATIANNPVGMPEVFPLRHHAAGIHHWLRSALPVVDLEEADAEQVAEAIVAEESVAEESVADEIVAEEIVAEEIVAEEIVAEEIVAEPLSDQVLAPFPAPKAPAHLAVPEWPRVDDEPAWEIPPDVTAVLPIVEPVVEPVVQPVVQPVVEPVFEPVALAAITPPVVEPEVFVSPPVVTSELVVPPESTLVALELPKLAAFNSVSNFAPTASQLAADAPAPNEDQTDIDGHPLPKLSLLPVSMKDLKMAAPTSETWGDTSSNIAAVQIWEMVDDLFDDPKKEEIQVGSGAPQGRSRGWLRKKN